jgi:hypothetical protein
MSQQLNAKEKKEWQQWLDLCESIQHGYEPIANESEREKQSRIKHLLDPKHFDEFIKYYFEHPDTPFAPLGWFHKEAINDVLVKRQPVQAWEWHRESAKSVFANIFFPVHLYVTGWMTGMILASENEGKAKNLLKDVEAHFRNNKRLIADFGDFGITGSWQQGYFRSKKGVGFWAFGLGQNPAGVRDGFNRPNYGVVDDADNKDAARNQTLTEQRFDWITGEFMGCLRTKGSIFILPNNRVHKHGLTAHFVGDLTPADPIREGVKQIKVYFTEDPKTHQIKMLEEGGVPAWKENFSNEEAKRKVQSMSYRNAMRQLYHMHIEDGNRFTDEMLPWAKPYQLHEYDALVSYCDPAFGESGKGCYRCVALLGRKGNTFDVLWVWIRQTGSFARAQMELAQKVRDGIPTFMAETVKFRPKVNCDHWVESNELQKPLLKNAYKELNDKGGEIWYPRFDMDKKADKIGRIENMETLAEHGHIRFNEQLRSDNDMLTLRDQFKGFPDGFIDGPDCIEGAIAKLNRKKSSSAIKPQSFKYNRNTQRMG